MLGGRKIRFRDLMKISSERCVDLIKIVFSGYDKITTIFSFDSLNLIDLMMLLTGFV